MSSADCIPMLVFTYYQFQAFWLAKDLSAENNWKIKRTEARLIGGQDAEIPSITESRLEVLTIS